MNKAELVDVMAKQTGVSKADTEKVLNAFIQTVENTVKKGDKVALVGFGTFEQVKRSARNGHNPQTGETIKIKAAKAPRFKAGKSFKDLVNGVKAKK